jgi:hypothetical protein
MIQREQVYELLLEACPSFRPVFDASDDRELHYVVAGEFASHLIQLYQRNDFNQFEAVSSFIELLHCDGDSYVKELATIGFLEAIQNVWGNSGFHPDLFVQWLQPVSLAYWKSLNKFWTGEIPNVGADLNSSG